MMEYLSPLYPDACSKYEKSALTWTSIMFKIVFLGIRYIVSSYFNSEVYEFSLQRLLSTFNLNDISPTLRRAACAKCLNFLPESWKDYRWKKYL